MFGDKVNANMEDLANDEWITFFGGLLLRHIQIIAINARDVCITLLTYIDVKF